MSTEELMMKMLSLWRRSVRLRCSVVVGANLFETSSRPTLPIAFVLSLIVNPPTSRIILTPRNMH